MTPEQLLNAKPPECELELSRIEISKDEHDRMRMHVVLEGENWWEEEPRKRGSTEVTLENVGEYSLSLRPGEKGGEILFSESHPLLGDFGAYASVFGQAPMPDPYRFFLEFHRLVRDELGLAREPVSYLNYPGTIGKWFGIVYQRSFGLLTAPLIVAEGAAKLLEAQAADHIVLPEPTRVSPPMGVAFICGKSWAVAEHGFVTINP